MHHTDLQSVFNVTAWLVLEQAEPSFDGNSCKYAGPNSTACAVGQHLSRKTAELCDTHFGNGVNWTHLAHTVDPAVEPHITRELTIRFGKGWRDNQEFVSLMGSLQRAHDSAACPRPGVDFVPQYIEAMKVVAEEYNLDPSILDA